MASDALHLAQSDKYVGDNEDDHYWSWSIWVVGSKKELDCIEYVEYTLHYTFPNPVRRVRNRKTKFRLDTAGWGVFTIYANAFTKDGHVIPLKHALKLHWPVDE